MWVGLGPLPNVADLQRRVHRDLGGDGQFETEHEGKAALKELLSSAWRLESAVRPVRWVSTSRVVECCASAIAGALRRRWAK